MITISISNKKGGVGKTTTAHNLAYGLKQRGYKVLLLDLDNQQSLTTITNNNKNKLSSYELLTNRASINEVIENDFIKASEKLGLLDMELNNRINKPYILKEALDHVKNNYDYCIIDTPPNIDIITINSFVASNIVIIPTTTDILTIKCDITISNAIEDIRKYYNKDLKIGGLLLVKWNSRSILNRQLKEQLEALKIAPIYKTFIREAIATQEAQAMKQSIIEYAPNSKPAIDYQNFITEFLEGDKQ